MDKPIQTAMFPMDEVGTKNSTKTKTRVVKKKATTVQEIVEDKKAENDRKAKEGRMDYAKAKRAKGRAFNEEKKNRSKIIAFYSGGIWHKIGGNSALIYAYILAKRLNIDVRIREDKDEYYTFSQGIISVRSIDDLIEQFKKIGVKVSSRDDELVIFDLGYTLTDAEFKAICDVRKNRIKNINRIVDVKAAYPKIMVKQRRVAMLLRTQMMEKPDYRNYILTDIARKALELCLDVMEISTGRRDAKECLTEVRQENTRLSICVRELLDLNIVSDENTLKIVSALADVNELIDKELARL